MKALSVFSGGLDSILAAEVIRGQEIEVQALFFETPFFPAAKALKSAAAIQLPIKVVDIFEEHLEIVKNPMHGYGVNMNPCIDCHILMLRRAGEMLKEEGADFVITGEVLGQRPMSQHRRALTMIAKESGWGGLILRPLSARLLPPTIPEERGWVKRDALLDWSGRSRKPQIALAEGMGIRQYPSPAGGCLLTDGIFSRRLRDLMDNLSRFERRDVELLKLGRHFRTGSGVKMIVGRNKNENRDLLALSGEGDLLLRPLSVPGPTVLAVGDLSEDSEAFAASLTVAYSDAGEGEGTEVRVIGRGGDRVLNVVKEDKARFKDFMI